MAFCKHLFTTLLCCGSNQCRESKNTALYMQKCVALVDLTTRPQVLHLYSFKKDCLPSTKYKLLCEELAHHYRYWVGQVEIEEPDPRILLAFKLLEVGRAEMTYN